MSRADSDLAGRVARRFRAGASRLPAAASPHDDPQQGAATGEAVLAELARLVRDEAPLLADEEVWSTAGTLAVELVGLGSVQALLDDPNVSDVLVNGPGEVWVERSGRLEPSGVALDRAAVERAIERLVGPLGLQADRTHPVVDARLADGTRVTAVLPPVAVDGPVLAVRRHRRQPVPLIDMAPGAACAALRDRLESRRNIVVFGPTGSGKTTLLASLVAELPPAERIVTVEDVAELQLAGPGVVRLEARPGSADGIGRADVRHLVRAALRLRPDRLVIGEVRGGEAADMVWALNTGHDGSMSTVHAPSAEDALRRITAFAVLGADGAPADVVRGQVNSAVHTLVGVSRRSDGSRRVVSVHDVDHLDGTLLSVVADRERRP